MERTGHLARVTRAVGGDAVDALIDLPSRDLQSLLMHVFAARAERASPLDLLARHEQAPFFAPGLVEPRAALALTSAAFEAASVFEAVALSPVTPLAAARALGGIHVNNVLAATRGGELVSDPTIPLALIAASRRRAPAAREQPLRLCSSHRVIRMQPFPPGLLPHFNLFALLTAERRGREAESLREHVAVYLDLFRLLGARGYTIADIEVEVADTDAVEHRLGDALAQVRREVRTHHWADPDALAARYGLAPLRGPADEVLAAAELPDPLRRRLERLATGTLAPLAAAYPEVRVRLDLTRLEGLGYYSGPCLRINARTADGARFALGDGGFLSWTAELLTDRRESLLSTGIGPDLLYLKFRG